MFSARVTLQPAGQERGIRQMEDTLISVGIDIGTSTTQLVFSHLTLKNMASCFAVPKIRITAKEIIFQSAIHQTPLITATEIDSGRVREIVEAEYRRAGILPVQVGTGAVIITGETARKANAAEVLLTLSGLAGEFVVATAGPALEGIIAGKGAHADVLSREKGAVVANLDIGGGTTNIAVFRGGEVIDTACLDIGGRLVKFNAEGTVAYASTKAKLLAAELGIGLVEGQPLAAKECNRLAGAMADILAQVLGCQPRNALTTKMATDKLLSLDYRIDYLTFSGGVAECMQQEQEGPASDPLCYHDLGIHLGRALLASEISQRFAVLQAGHTIRATVVGAGSHTTSLSGSTITLTEQVLPLQNVPVLKLSPEDEARPYSDWADCISRKLDWFTLNGEQQVPALACKGPKAPGFDVLQALAAAIIRGMDAVLEPEAPLIVILENDLAKALGQTLILQTGARRQVICIDAVAVEHGDYIDIGSPLANGNVVPVIVKTLALGY